MRILLAILALLLLSPVLSAQPAFPKRSEPLFDSVMKRINVKHVNWVKSTATEVNAKNLDSAGVKTKVNQYAVLGSMNNADIEALCFLVLMQAAKSAQEDLKAIMARVKAINNAKAQQRENLAAAQKTQAAAAGKDPNGSVTGLPQDFAKKLVLADSLRRVVNPRLTKYNSPKTFSDLNTLIDSWKKELDSMNELGEEMSLKLQMAMDRLSKMMSTLSNILKKLADTADAITGNLK